MNWLILVAIAVIADSLRIFVDNYTSDVYYKGRGSVSQKLFSGYVFIIFGIFTLVVTSFNFHNIDTLAAILFIVSGMISGIAGIPYYRALELDDSTNIGIFTQLAPVLYLILGWFFLNQSFSPLQLVAFLVILSAPFLIIATTRKKSRKIKIKAVINAFLYVLIAVIGNVLFVKISNDGQSFVSTISLFFVGLGIANILIVYSRPKLRRRYHEVNRRSHHKVLRPLTANAAIRIIQKYTYMGALLAAPSVAIASVSSDSAEPIVIFFMGLLLTLIWPKFGREKLERKIVMVHLIATVLVVIGVVLLQM